MSTTPQFTHEQLTAARAARWRQAAGSSSDQSGEQSGNQAGDALLTLETARDWINELGLVLFAPRAQQLAAPAPSLVEATLGHAAASPTAAETETARSLVARLTADGAALPLNLLGAQTTAGDTPDFIVSAQVFGYIFTLRGDKAWKQPPATSGAIKVSPLALKVYELLAEGKSASSAMTAAEIVSELGREVTENAILRALNELWSQLRVLPLLQQDGSATMWELTTRRFTKQLKSGANAGQPTALSALISLYLAQVYAALEDEIETFLSPLAARSRVRDVLHGLTAGRQLEDIVLEGKRLLYIPGELPEFLEIAAEPPAEAEGAAEIAASSETAKPAERIRRFDGPRKPRESRPYASREDRPRASRPRSAGGDRPRPSREGSSRPSGGDRPRPSRAAGAARPFGGDRPARSFSADRERPRKPFADKRDSPRAPRSEGKSFGDRERRPFQRNAAKPARPSFTRPWDEDRKPREAGEQADRPRREDRARAEGERPRTNERPRPSGDRPRPYGDRPRSGASARPPAGRKEFRPRTDRSERPSREGGADRPSRPFRPRSQEGDGTRPPRRDQDDRPRREGSARPSADRKEFRQRPDRGDRPSREGGANRPDRPARPFRPRPQGSEGTRPQKRFRTAGEDSGDTGAKRSFGSKPPAKRTFGAKPTGAKRTFGAKPAGKRPFGAKPFGKPGGFGKRASSDARPPRATGAARPPRGPNDTRPPRGVNPRTAKRNAKPSPPRETEE